jgi:thymidylate synthase
MELVANNTNDLQNRAYQTMSEHGFKVHTRNGPALRLPGITTILLRRPWQRVNFSLVRDANPFFHLIESVAMLAGNAGNDVPLLSFFAKNMLLFSDDGHEYNAFYGTRSRHTFGDQLTRVVEELRNNPESRQAVINLWDPTDLWRTTKDKACNLCMIFDIVDRRLNMTTFNRSNDAIWGGVTGANVVHLSFFQEYVACALGLYIGTWHHASANLHVYLDNPKWAALAAGDPYTEDSGRWYPIGQVPLFTDRDNTKFDEQLLMVLSWLKDLVADPEAAALGPVGNLFIDNTVIPMASAFAAWKHGKKQLAYDILFNVGCSDWKLAGLLWFKTREKQLVNPLTIDPYDYALYQPQP